MSPLDAHLRDTLTTHAQDVDVPVDLLGRVEHRARGIRRRRVATASVAVAAVVLSGAAVGTWLADRPDPGSAPMLVQPSPTPSDASPTPPAPTAFVLDWPYRSGDGAAALDPAASVHPLWGGRIGGSTVVVGQTVAANGAVSAHAWVTPADGPAYELDGVRITRTTHEVSFVLPGGATPYVLVVGAPQTGQISYAEDGSTMRPIDTRDGWAVFPRTGPTGSTSDRIEVLDGNGDLDHPLYRGPIDTGPASPDK